jgi:protochlorophyllide reductase
MALPSLERTEAGFEKQIGVNHFVSKSALSAFVGRSQFILQGHFYLTNLLLGRLAKSQSARVVVLSSVAHSFGKVDCADLHFRHGRSYRPWVAYGQSKSANLLFAKALADHCLKNKLDIAVVSVHPGEIKTNLWRWVSVVS